MPVRASPVKAWHPANLANLGMWECREGIHGTASSRRDSRHGVVEEDLRHSVGGLVQGDIDPIGTAQTTWNTAYTTQGGP